MVLGNKIKLVIFDLDGTLVDSQYDLTDSVNFVRHEYGLNPLPVPKVASYLGSGITALVKAVLAELKNENFDVAVKMFKDNYAKHLTDKTLPYNDIAESFQNKFWKHSVFQNILRKFTAEILLRRRNLILYLYTKF